MSQLEHKIHKKNNTTEKQNKTDVPCSTRETTDLTILFCTFQII